MKICAHLALSPYSSGYKKFDSIKSAKAWLWNYLYREGNLGPYDENYPVIINIYPQCNQCYSGACFHDELLSRLQVGPHGGIRKVAV